MLAQAFVFPGQGSQFVGMGKDLSETFTAARHTFEEVDEALSDNLSRLMFEGEPDILGLTQNTQPALMAVSMAIINVLRHEAKINIPPLCRFFAGHSLGEYTALTASGALDLRDTARLLRLRGQFMQEAVPVGTGAMAAILGLDPDILADIAQTVSQDPQGGICALANDNAPGQIVLSGHKHAVERAAAMAKERGAKKVIFLSVSAPSHCPLMAPAAQKMSRVLAETNLRPPTRPIVANVTAQGVEDTGTLRRLLVDQITGPVRWRESVLWMADQGVTRITEIGAGKVLSGLIRRISPDIETGSVGTTEQVENLIYALQG